MQLLRDRMVSAVRVRRALQTMPWHFRKILAIDFKEVRRAQHPADRRFQMRNNPSEFYFNVRRSGISCHSANFFARILQFWMELTAPFSR